MVKQMEHKMVEKVKHQKIKLKIEQDEFSSNVYGFEKRLLQSPTSTLMMNSSMIKNADVERMERLFTMMKKRKLQSQHSMLGQGSVGTQS